MTNLLLLRKSIILVLCCFSLCSISNLAKAGNGDYQDGMMVCEMKAGYDISAITSLYNVAVIDLQSQTSAYLLQAQPGVDVDSLAFMISKYSDVLYCNPNYYLDAPEPFQRSQPFIDAQHTGGFNSQPATAAIGLTAAHIIATGSGVKIGIVDTGVNFDHPLFAAKSSHLHSGFDFVDNDAIANDATSGPGAGHGTFVTGIVTLVAPNSDIYIYRALDTLGRNTTYMISDAVLKAVADGCKVINLSLGMRNKEECLDHALNYAKDHNVIVIAAAGNDSTDVESVFPFPANSSATIAIAALDSTEKKADFSNYGNHIALCAPGTRIYSPYLDSSYAWWDGTSFSTPFVTGLVGLMLSVDPTLSWQNVRAILRNTATNIDALNPNLQGELGTGMINPVAALQQASAYICGDVDRSGTVNVTDAIYLINYIFAGGAPPVPMVAGDNNCSGMINISDVVYLVQFIFSGGPAPCNGC